MAAPVSSSPIPRTVGTCFRSICRSERSHIRRPILRNAFSTTTSSNQEMQIERGERPRWQQTPKAMAMPIRIRPQPNQPVFEVNNSPKVLDEAYNKMLGKGGDKMLPEEVKWLAITHKSFDHGRRGLNDRLAFLGKRIVDLQCSLALLNAPVVDERGQHDSPQYERGHPALRGLANVTANSKQQILEKSRLSRLAQDYGIQSVMRWKPKKSDNLKGSGVDVVSAHTLYAIIGAISLQRGGEVANKVVRERILSPLGLN